MNVTLNAEQSLFVIENGRGYSCLGFWHCHRVTGEIALELERPGLQSTEIGTIRAYLQYRRAMIAAHCRYRRTGQRLRCGLTPQLLGLEHQRVEVIDCDGQKRRFIVGRSTGWMPCHLEIKTRRSRGGSPVMGAPFRSVRRID